MTDIDRARAFVASQEWIFAKTMADIPHFYCLKMYAGDPSEFEWFVQYMTTHSVPGWFYTQEYQYFYRHWQAMRVVKRWFYTQEYQYFYLDEWKYWIMDANAGECDLINREQSEK